jgi:predicted DNA-binding ribbon-helix-helix protein
MAIDNIARNIRPRPFGTEGGISEPQVQVQMKAPRPAIAPADAQDPNAAAKAGKQAYPCIEITPRSVWIGSRRTSIRLEPEFWTALGEIAREQRSTISGVLLDIERIHGRSRFASKVRVAILAYYRR